MRLNLYSINKYYELSLKSNKKYDVYIIIRSDDFLLNFPDIINTNKIIIWNRFPDRINVIDISIFVCPNNNIKLYSEFYKIEYIVTKVIHLIIKK